MSTSRRYEVKKKRQAVRRLSQGSRQGLPSPQGDGKFSFKRQSPEEYAEKKRRMQQRLGTLGGSSRNKGNARQASRKADNPHIWIRGDLRNKLSPRKGAENQRQENVAPGGVQFQTQKQSKPFVPSDLQPPQPLLPPDPKKLTSFNPFAAALQTSTAPQERSESKPHTDESTIFGSPLSKNEKSLAIGSGENIRVGPRLFADVVQNRPITTTRESSSAVFANVPSIGTNPFLLAQPKGVTEVPVPTKQNDKPSAAPMPFSVTPFPKPDAPIIDPVTNPFASALQEFKPKEREPRVMKHALVDLKPRQDGTFKPAFNPFQMNQEIGTAVSTIFQPPTMAPKPSSTVIPAMVVRPSSTPFSQDTPATVESTSIKLMGLPDDLNNKEFLRGFFSQFGDVKRVYSHLFTNSAIITFFNHDSAAAAKANGTVLHQGQPPISIFWLKAKNAKASIAKDESVSESSEISDVEVLSKPVMLQSKVATSSSSASLKKSAFKKMVVDYVSTLKNTPVRDANEKAEFLEKIDQKIREGMKKETDLKKASLLIGTCPDICPEKERYLREFQQRLAVYEVKSGTESADTLSGQYPTADPFKVVKEYSRSSADQEEPLPHELRPASTLQLTMDYLMLNVMDAGERNWADWYDFVWNRTRGIRKDITQQHLCDESSIDLIEKCARFHIICAHHLCEENINAFDPKINNENLIKCLQSLKHMYEDIYYQKGKICPNEAEFRCYQILLNLNNGDILREVTEFRHGVRESQEVKFALQVFRALNSTNYVRFFKLLNAGSYLMACIMQRYFNQIRSMALFIMNKAYCGMNKPVPIPLSEIARLFAIDEIDEASEFCEHYGFQVDDGMVYFSKSSYIEPESNFLPVRNGVIERKRLCSFGEVVNGKPLTIIQYTPTNSFDENGYYNGVYHELALKGIRRASDQASESGLQIPYISETDSGSDRAAQMPMKVAKDDIKAMCVALLLPVINQEVHKVATETMESVRETLVCANHLVDEIVERTVRAEIKTYLQHEMQQSKSDQIARDILGDIFDKVTRSQIKEVVTAEFDAERRKKYDARKMEVFQLTTEISKDILWKSVDVNLRSVASNAIKAERQENHLKIISQASVISGRELLEDFLTKEMRNISGQAIALEVKERKEKLEKIKQKVITLRTGRILKRWIRELETRRHIRETLHDFPACRPLKSSPEMIRALTRQSSHAANLPDYVTLTNGVELTVSSVSSLERRRGQHRNAVEKFHQQIISERRELTRPIDPKPLLNVMAKRLKRSHTRELYSKLVVSVPEPMKTSKASVVNPELIKKKFIMDSESFDLDEDIELPSLDTLYRTTEMVQNGIVSLCVKGLSGAFAEDEDEIRETRELFGITGIIFVLEVDNFQTWTKEYERLSRILSLNPANPAIPLLVISIGNSQEDNAEDIVGNLQLKRIKQERKISDYEVLIIDHEMDGIKLNEELNYGLISLVAQTPEIPKLQMKTLANCIEEGMQVNFYDSLYRERMKRRDAALHSMGGKPIVDLYNSVLDHLSDVCTHQSLTEISWPTKENVRENVKDCPNLHWNDEESIFQIRAFLDSLKLPELVEDADPGGDWDEQQQTCLEYLYRIMSSHSFGAHPSELISRVERVINQYITKWKYRSFNYSIDFPWSLILEECTHFLLASVHKPRSDVNGQTVVCYFKEHWYNFRPPKSWIEEKDFSRWNSSKENLSISQKLNSSSRNEYLERSIREVDETFTIIEQSLSLTREPLDISHAVSPLEDLLKKQKSLENSLNMERVAYSRLSDRSAILARDFAPDTAVPLSGVKRKRTTDASREPKVIPSLPLGKTNSIESLNRDLKRPKRLLESRIDDLLNEVKFMRSAFDLDHVRNFDIVNS